MNRQVTTFFRFPLALAFAFLCVSARADSIETFNFSGTLATFPSNNFNTSVTGSFTLDTTTGTIVAFDFNTPTGQIAAATGWSAALFTYTPALFPSANFVGLVFTDPVAPVPDSLDLLFETSLSSFSGNTFYTGFVQPTSGPSNVSRLNCVYQNLTFCTGFLASSFTSGNAVPVSAVPEPSSMLLFGTGIVAIVSTVRRKLPR